MPSKVLPGTGELREGASLPVQCWLLPETEQESRPAPPRALVISTPDRVLVAAPNGMASPVTWPIRDP